MSSVWLRFGMTMSRLVMVWYRLRLRIKRDKFMCISCDL